MTTNKFTKIAAAKPNLKPYAAHKIGDAYGGGIVFYVYDGGQHGLIAATEDLNDIRWSATLTTTGSRANGVGAGKANTILIIANQAPVDGAPFAASVCNEYQGGGYGDWYLPSSSELNLLWAHRDLVGANGNYWCSNENDSDTVVNIHFETGMAYMTTKTEERGVRCIRAF